MTWVIWRQYRHQGAVTAALLAALAVVLGITGLHAAHVWHSAFANCTKGGSCGAYGLSLASPVIASLVTATSAVPLLPGLLWGTAIVAAELEAGTHQFAWTQSITRRRWLTVKAGWLVLTAAVLAGAVSALVTWWLRPDNAQMSDAFQVNRFDITDIVPVGYAIFAVALGICAGVLLRRTIPAFAVTLAGFVGLRMLTAQWLRPRYMTPVTAHYKLSAPFLPSGSYLGVSLGTTGPNGKPLPLDFRVPNYNGAPLPAACQHVVSPDPQAVVPCLMAHGYRGLMNYQPASRFWAFQGIETGIYVALAAALLGIAFWVLRRRDA